MKRRKFLKNTSALTLPIFVGGLPLQGLSKPTAFSGMNSDSERVLVIIQLNGGNDGLNTLMPLDSYDNLANLRSNIILPQSSFIQINDKTGFHPSFAGMADLYDKGKLNILQNVGYPNQNRSHFRSTDIWSSGSSADEYVNTGWVGRYFESKFPGFPEGYPSADCPDPFAMTIGGSVSETCQGVSGNYSVAVKNPNDLFELPEGAEGDYDPNSCYGQHLDFVRTSIKQTNAYADRIIESYNSATNQAAYPDTLLARQLKVVAGLIQGGLKTRVFVVSQGGYDTHANQTASWDPLLGVHANLLEELGDAINAFQTDIDLMGLGEKVAGMTFSEFGRQIRSNDGFGTDHGNAAPLFVFGNCVNPGIIGDNPEIPVDVQVQTGVPLQYDFRSVYGSLLMDWFEVPEEGVKDILFDEFQYIPILASCNMPSDSNDLTEESLSVEVFPNPFAEWVTIKFPSKSEWMKVTIFDALGQERKVLAAQNFDAGVHELRFEARGLAPGNYFVHVSSETEVKTKSLIKVGN